MTGNIMKIDTLLHDLWWQPWIQTAKFWLEFTMDQDRPALMRRFIRHPSDIPIEYQVNNGDHLQRRPLKNIGAGGLCFVSEQPIAQGAKIHIHIPLAFEQVKDDCFDAEGYVAWCLAEEGAYTVGVEFDDQSSRYSVRMVEQVCHIEHYRADVREHEGRELTSEEAAKEWVERYAAEFPQ